MDIDELHDSMAMIVYNRNDYSGSIMILIDPIHVSLTPNHQFRLSYQQSKCVTIITLIIIIKLITLLIDAFMSLQP